MNRRVRSPNPKLSPSASRLEERLHRFLKPGALARLRDSRISNARSPRSAAFRGLSPPSSPSPTAAAAQIEGLPYFAIRSYGLRFPQRKKLAAAKSIFFAPSSPELIDSFLDAFGVDLVVAH